MGSHKGLLKDGTAIPVPTTLAGATTFKNDCYAGNVTQAGHVIRFTGTFYPDVELSIANFAPGVRLTGTGKISAKRTLPGPFTQPDSGGHPNVWLAAGAYLKSASGFDDVGPTIEVDGYQFDPFGAANLAAAIGTLDSPYKVWVNADGIYFNSAGNPNTDGLSRYYFNVMEQGLGGYLAMVEISAGMIDSSLTIEAGVIYRYTAGVAVPQYGLMVVNGHKTVASVSCLIIGGSYHALGWIGQSLDGILCFNGTRFSKFCPVTNGSTIAMYDPTQTLGNISNVFTPDVAELDSIFVGERASDAVRAYESIGMHGKNAFDEYKWRSIFDGTWKGAIGTAFHLPGERIVEPTCTAYDIVGD